ncbi:carbohydrate kinase family protein [Rhizorhapis sp. SPR117]|nr:carbohydrate kinase family protein [Rhizorhapis sp. SPR117]
MVVTLGGEGASIANKDGSRRLAARPVTARSPVSTGASFVSTATVALTQGQPLDAVPMALLPVQPPCRLWVERLYSALPQRIATDG